MISSREIIKETNKISLQFYTIRSFLLFSLLLASSVFSLPHKPTLFLLDSPINATWAANHSEMWHEKGFNGFLFEGLVDNLTPYPSEEQQVSISPSSVAPPANMQEEQIIPGNWDALITEIRAAVNRLKPAGLDQNFLRLTLTPEAPYFTDASLRKIVENRLRLAGEFCQKTGLRGIAIDTQSQNAIYDYRWAGYPVSSSTEILTQGARQFGKEILRAFIRACPEGKILLLAQSPELSGPLWFPFLEGVLESTGAATTIQIHLALNENRLSKSVESYKNHPQRMHSMFQQRLSTTSFNRWEHQGSIVFSLDPIRYQGDIPTARYPLPKYRSALYAATLYGNAYTLISARQGGWWHIPPDLVTQFKHLHQGGNARVSFAPPVPTPLDAYAPRIDIADTTHIGNISINGEVLEVLNQEGKIKLLAWNGLSKGLCTATATGMVTTTNLITGEQRYFTPDKGETIVPPQTGMLLISGIPGKMFSLAAGMKMRLLKPIQAGITRSELEIEIHNPLPSPMRGILSLNTEAAYSTGSALMAVNLDPGESVLFHRMLQGISYMGHQPYFSMNLHIATGTPIVHTASFPVEPPEIFRLCMDGPVMGSPILLQKQRKGTPYIIAGDLRGNLVCFDSIAQKELWRYRMRGTYNQVPLRLKNTMAELLIALQNEHGRIRFFNSFGEEKVVIFPRQDEAALITTVIDPKDSTIDLAIVENNETISIYTASGTLKKQFKSNDVSSIISTPALPGFLFTVSVSTKETDSSRTEITLTARHLKENMLWEKNLKHPIICPPVVYIENKKPAPTLIVGDTAGTLSCYNAANGSLLETCYGENNSAIKHLVAFDNKDQDILLLAAADIDSLALYELQNSTIKQLWSFPLSHITALAPLPDNEGIAAGLENGSVYAFATDATLMWEEHQSAGMITGLEFYEDQTHANTYIAIVSSQAGLIRGLRIRRELIRSKGRLELATPTFKHHDLQ